MGKVKKVLLGILDTISVLIIICSIAVLLTVVFTKKGDAPNFLGFSLFRVMTGSMEPEIPVDALIVVKQTDATLLAEGDVITFYSRDPSLHGEVNTHRILRIENDEDGETVFVTKGDANNVEDRYPTLQEDLIGKVVYSSAGMGKLVRLISNPLIFIPLIVIPLILILGRNVLDSIRLAKKLAREEEEAAVREAIEEIRQKKKKEEEV